MLNADCKHASFFDLTVSTVMVELWTVSSPSQAKPQLPLSCNITMSKHRLPKLLPKPVEKGSTSDTYEKELKSRNKGKDRQGIIVETPRWIVETWVAASENCSNSGHYHTCLVCVHHPLHPNSAIGCDRSTAVPKV